MPSENSALPEDSGVKSAKNRSLLFADHGADLYQMICEGNLEGVVAKRKNSKHAVSARWIKIKNPTYTQSEGRHELCPPGCSVRLDDAGSSEKSAGVISAVSWKATPHPELPHAPPVTPP